MWCTELTYFLDSKGTKKRENSYLSLLLMILLFICFHS